MADTGERDVRDRLAEAVYLASTTDRAKRWPKVREDIRADCFIISDDLITALPTVGLRIGRVEE